MKRVSDQAITFEEINDAETSKEIRERKGLGEKSIYRFLDGLEKQGIKVGHCKVMRRARNGVWQPVDAYFIKD